MSEPVKVALVAFQGEAMCFVHVLLNALDLKARGHDARIVIEGAATHLIAELADPAQPFAGLYARVRAAGLIDAVCQACAAKMGALEAARAQGLPVVGDMSGHPPLAPYLEAGFRILTF